VHGRELEKEKVKHHEAARAAGIDETVVNLDDMCEHESKWFNIVNDLVFVMEVAQDWPAPSESTPGTVGATTAWGK
jgi:hypothetical protein